MTVRQSSCVVVFLLGLQAALLGYSAWCHSPTLNEPAHLASGITHWRTNRFELYCVNPPLVRMVAALPCLLADPVVDWGRFRLTPRSRPEFSIGADFVEANSTSIFRLTTWARWACIPFCLLGGYVCWSWARDLFGVFSGILACSMWVFSPSILGLGAVIVPDAHASALGIAATYGFWRWLRTPTWRLAALSGGLLGLALLAKSIFLLLPVVFTLVWLVGLVGKGRESRAGAVSATLPMLLAEMLVAFCVLNLLYGFRGSFRPLRSYSFVSSRLAGIDVDSPAAPPTGNRFVGSMIGSLPLPLPADYVRGIDLQWYDFQNTRRLSYLAGQWSDGGWWYYYKYSGCPLATRRCFTQRSCGYSRDSRGG